VPHVAAAHQHAERAALSVDEDEGGGVARAQRSGAERGRFEPVHLGFGQSIHRGSLRHGRGGWKWAIGRRASNSEKGDPQPASIPDMCRKSHTPRKQGVEVPDDTAKGLPSLPLRKYFR
jgi:hypothetical protein